MQTGALLASAADAADISSLCFDDLKDRFLSLFPRRTESIWKKRGQKRWFTQHGIQLSDQQILSAANCKLQQFAGARFGRLTRFAVIDIDTISPYYNVLSLVRLRRALEVAGLIITQHYQSSDSGGWHIWIFFDEAVDSNEVNRILSAWLKKQGFKLGSGVLEVFPSANGLRLPLQPGFAWLSSGVRRDELTLEQALRLFLQDASCSNNWHHAAEHIAGELVADISEHQPRKRRSGLIPERWKLGQELWRTGLQHWGQRHDAMLAVEHYLWFGDDDAGIEALPGYNNDAAREQLIVDWLERKHNGMCRHINRGDWKKVSADIQRACAWRPSVHVHTPYAHTDRKIERMMEDPTLTPKRFITGNIARYNYALARITSAYNELATSGRTPSINEVAARAGAHWNTVRKHWNILTASSSDQSPGISPGSEALDVLSPSVGSVEHRDRVSVDGFSVLFSSNASEPLSKPSFTPLSFANQLPNLTVINRAYSKRGALQMGESAIRETGERAALAPSNDSRGLMPTLSDMQRHAQIFRTNAARNDEPESLFLNDPFGSETKWMLHADNVPAVTKGIQSYEDVQQLGQGIFGEPLELLSKKNAVKDSLLQLGPVLDTAVNYYGNKIQQADGQGFLNDAHSFGSTLIKGTAESIDHAATKLQEPQSQKEIGSEVLCAAGPVMLLGRAGKMIEFLKDSIEMVPATNALGESIWTKGWSLRGFAAEGEMGNSGVLAKNFRTIDDAVFKDGVFTSMKSIDLNAPTYQNMDKLERVLNRYLDKVVDWEGQPKPWGRVRINPNQIQERVLHLGIPKGAMTEEQARTFEKVAERAQNAGVKVKLTVIE